MPRTKGLRQKVILQIIEEKPISTQEELVKELNARGYHTSQATLSKDIRELGLVKVPTADGTFRYTADFRAHIESPSTLLIRRLHESVIEFHSATQLLILRTLPGYAPSVAFELDRTKWEEIVGTIAGDDTVFIAVSSSKDIKSLEKRLKEILTLSEVKPEEEEESKAVGAE